MLAFKIRRKSDGLFSGGGTYPRFSTKGKTWSQRGHLTNHLNQIRRRDVYNDCEIVQYVVKETEVNAFPASEYIAERNEERKRREEEAILRQEAIEKEKRYREFLRLSQEFGREEFENG